jgi:thiamine biosynthesis lipoprotein
VIHLRNGAVATSGSYEIAFDRHRVHHHIVDPRTALSPGLCSSATVTAGTVMQADALATAAFVLPPRAGFELIDALPGAEALLITDNGTALPTRRWGFERS